MIDNVLNAEQEFRMFVSSKSNTEFADRYVRLNPDLGIDLNKDPPALDEVSKLHELRHDVQSLYRQPKYVLQAERTAYRLVASTFFFAKEKEVVYVKEQRIYICRGMSSNRQISVTRLTSQVGSLVVSKGEQRICRVSCVHWAISFRNKVLKAFNHISPYEMLEMILINTR